MNRSDLRPGDRVAFVDDSDAAGPGSAEQTEGVVVAPLDPADGVDGFAVRLDDGTERLVSDSALWLVCGVL